MEEFLKNDLFACDFGALCVIWDILRVINRFVDFYFTLKWIDHIRKGFEDFLLISCELKRVFLCKHAGLRGFQSILFPLFFFFLFLPQSFLDPSKKNHKNSHSRQSLARFILFHFWACRHHLHLVFKPNCALRIVSFGTSIHVLRIFQVKNIFGNHSSI